MIDYRSIASRFFKAVILQNADDIRNYFHPFALIKWHNTNEKFTVEEYIRVNCEYPGNWHGRLERQEEVEKIFCCDHPGESHTLIIQITKVWDDENNSFHCTSFIKFQEGKISQIDEYWGKDEPAPEWRQKCFT